MGRSVYSYGSPSYGSSSYGSDKYSKSYNPKPSYGTYQDDYESYEKPSGYGSYGHDDYSKKPSYRRKRSVDSYGSPSYGSSSYGSSSYGYDKYSKNLSYRHKRSIPPFNQFPQLPLFSQLQGQFQEMIGMLHGLNGTLIRALNPLNKLNRTRMGRAIPLPRPVVLLQVQMQEIIDMLHGLNGNLASLNPLNKLNTTRSKRSVYSYDKNYGSSNGYSKKSYNPKPSYGSYQEDYDSYEKPRGYDRYAKKQTYKTVGGGYEKSYESYEDPHGHGSSYGQEYSKESYNPEPSYGSHYEEEGYGQEYKPTEYKAGAYDSYKGY